MAKKNKTKTPKVVNVTPTYTVGTKLILSDEKTMLDKCTIAKIEETGYVLSNGVKVNFDLRRIDGRDGHCFLHDENGENHLQAYFAQMVILRTLPDIQKKITDMDKMKFTPEEAQAILKVNRLVNKIKSTLDND